MAFGFRVLGLGFWVLGLGDLIPKAHKGICKKAFAGWLRDLGGLFQDIQSTCACFVPNSPVFFPYHHCAYAHLLMLSACDSDDDDYFKYLFN